MFVVAASGFLLMFGMIMLIGNFEVGNSLAVNSTIAGNFNAIGANPSNPSGCAANSIFCGFGSFANGVNNTATSLQAFNSNPISSVISTVSLIGSFIFSIPSIFNIFGAFIAVPLVAIGIPVGFAQIIGQIIMVGIFGLGLLSGIFLFPI